MKCLQSRVNLIPVIGKADTLTPSEVKKLKDQILEDLRTYQIQVSIVNLFSQQSKLRYKKKFGH